MTLKPNTRIVTHVDFYKRPVSVVRNGLWDAAANHLAQEILAKEYSGKEAVAFIRTAWPEVTFSLLGKSPSFEYTKEQFLALPFSSQQNWAGPAHNLIQLMRAVESKLKLMNYLVATSGSANVIV